jgi:hypothetical protein
VKNSKQWLLLRKFKLSRGVKQGCPNSIMAIEMLVIKIRSKNNIKGLEIQGLKTKVYADDSCSFLIHNVDPSTAS